MRTEKVSNLIDGMMYTIQGNDQLATWDLVVSEVLDSEKTTIENDMPPLDEGWEYRIFRVLAALRAMPGIFSAPSSHNLDRMTMFIQILRLPLFATAILGWIMGASHAQTAEPVSYAKMAAEVTESIHSKFWLGERGLYSRATDVRSPDFIWGAGVMFSTLATAARHDSIYQDIMSRNFNGMEVYWDTKVAIPGYEPAPTSGGGNDKYYDDNAWMVICFIEAYEITGDMRYLKRAGETLDFVMSGWDDILGGGIWWHEKHKDDSKNTCANAPTAVACFRLSKHVEGDEREKRIADGMKITDWTTRTLRGKNSLFGDNIKRDGQVNNGQLTYNSALMLRAYLNIHALTGKDTYLQEARQMGRAADAFLDPKTGAYRDKLRWSHLMVEADLELYRWTGEDYLLKRARTNCDVYYAQWKKDPPTELIDQASLARQLWLMADHESETGRTFWKESDRLRN